MWNPGTPLDPSLELEDRRTKLRVDRRTEPYYHSIGIVISYYTNITIWVERSYSGTVPKDNVCLRPRQAQEAASA